MKVRVCGFSPARPPSWPLALAVALAACAAPALVDVDGQRLERPLLVAGVHNGWVAVDSSAGGVRAVLELRAETRPPETPPWEEDGLTLQFAGYPAIAPARLRCEEPRCCRPAPGEVGCPRGAEPVQEEPPPAVEAGCLHVVHAEFTLPRVPSPADSVILRIGGVATLLRWR